MKKNIILIILASFVLLISSCGGNKKNDDANKDTTNAPANSKTDTLPKNSYNYLHIIKTFDKTIPIGDNQVYFTPELKQVFTVDNNAFIAKYLSGVKPILTNSSSFTFSVYELYHIMQVGLKLQKDIESGTNKFNGIRIYPALDTAGKKKQLYLVLMGEKTTVDPLKFITMRDTFNAFTIRDKRFTNITKNSPAYGQMVKDIALFKTFWMTSENVTKENMNRSISFSISEYYELLNFLDPGMIKDTANANANYKLELFPCLSNKKLRLVIKGIKGFTRMEAADDDFYNNMDVCPDKCPENEY